MMGRERPWRAKELLPITAHKDEIGKHKASSTRASKTVAPLSVEGQIGRGHEEVTQSRAMCHSHHVHSQHLIFYAAGEEPAC